MALTLDQIIEEARHLPAAERAELVKRLTHEFPDSSEMEDAWKTETRKRIAEIENGQVQTIPGEVVSARIRQIVGR